MAEHPKALFKKWKLDELLQAHPGLQLQPSANGHIRLTGTLDFTASKPGLERISGSFDIDIEITTGFPRELPIVNEVGGKIPPGYHRNSNGALCLGSPTEQLLTFISTPTLLSFVERCLIPYFYGYLYFEKHGALPFGELKHGMMGIRENYAALFGVADEDIAVEIVRLASMKKREANKQCCPCGSGKRFGKCHNRRINHIRKQLGRNWFAAEYQWLQRD